MTTDNAIRDHQTWLGYLQPDGLVVSPAALVDAQVYLDRDAADRQREFTQFVQDVDLGERDVAAIQDLRRFLVDFLDWPEDLVFGASPERSVPADLTVGLPELNETLAPSLALADIGSDDAAPGWLLLVKEVPLGTDLDARETGRDSTWSASATQKLERLLRETAVPIGLLSNGTQLRLLYAPRGENSGSLTFPMQAMTEVAGRAILSAFWGLLSRERLLSGPAEARLPGLLVKSREYQASVSRELSGQVLDALYELVRGLQAADSYTRGELLRKVLAEHPDEVYRALLTVLLRLVFLLYAEDRALLPTSALYSANYSVHGLFTRLRSDAQKYPDTMDQRWGAWPQLVALFRAVYGGSKHTQLTMPPRKGFLFDPERFPFLEGRSGPERSQLPLIADGVIYRVLEKLLLLAGERLSYRTLDVEQIGSVYETMMGFRLEKTADRTIALRAGKSGGAPVAIDLDGLLKLRPTDRSKYLEDRADLKLTDKAAASLRDATGLDQLLAVLERRIARNATPAVLPAGSMVLQPTDERRRSGSHYTPRSLTEPIVRTTLRPILDRLGSNPEPAQILALKVCDIAVGSGAFLVETCRQLGDTLLKAWHAHSSTPHIPPDEDEVLHARRIVAQRCLYGVDRNPMAVDLTKLSLWLATLAKDHPFTFLDHAVRNGDSLVGLTAKQIGDFHWLPESKRVFGQEFLEQRIATAMTQRQLILTLDDDLTGPELKLQKLHLADEALDTVREAGDLVIAAFFDGENSKARLHKRAEHLAQFTEFYRGFDPKLSTGPIVKSLREGENPVVPFHWEIEFPEVFSSARCGFDAIVGNPPFAGKNTTTSANVAGYLDWLKLLHEESHGNADLVAHFFRRAFDLLRHAGTLGLIGTKTIRQGDTRSTGLRWICTHGGEIFAARRRLRWPGGAAVIVSVVNIAKGPSPCMPELDGKKVEQITAYLFHQGGHEDPSTLLANAARSFQGSIPLGMGFTFDDEDKKGIASSIRAMERLITQDPRNAELIRPFIGYSEVADQPSHSPRRYIINFGEMSEEEARHWPDLMAIVEEKVRPERLAQKDQKAKLEWWRFHRHAHALNAAIEGHERVLVAGSQASAHFAFAFLPKGYVYSSNLTVLACETYSAFSSVQSRVHEEWARFFMSTMKDDLAYTPTTCFETFPFPLAWQTQSTLEAAGKAYYEFRAELMVRNNEGLTKTYNRFHKREERDPEIVELRELHAAMDRAVLDAYRWTDIDPTCEFLLDYEDEEDAETSGRKKRPWRYRWPDEVRDEVLARLLALNAERFEEERLAGEAMAKTSKKAPGRRSTSKRSSTPDGGSLFDT